MPDNLVTYAGWIFKEGSLVKSWKKRFLVVKRAELAYYKDIDQENRAQLLGAMTVARIEKVSDITNGLLIHGVDGRQLKIFTDTKAERDKCYHAIAQWCRDRNQRQLAASTVDTSTSGSGSVKRVGWLEKEGQTFRTWKKRYFVLDNNVLAYYAQIGTSPLSSGNIIGARRDNTRPFTLIVALEGGREMRIGGKSEFEIDDWHKAMRQSLQLHSSMRDQMRMSYEATRNSMGHACTSPVQYDGDEQELSPLFGAPPFGSSDNAQHTRSNDVVPPSPATTRELYASSSFRRHIILEVAEDNTASFIECEPEERESDVGQQDQSGEKQKKPYSPTAPGEAQIRKMRLAEMLLREELEEEQREAMLKEKERRSSMANNKASDVSGGPCCCVIM